jgi:RNA polymerase sigma-70 factor (ECF subfamily)
MCVKLSNYSCSKKGEVDNDIMQETTIVMYEKFDNFQRGTDFFAWAKTIAKYKTLEFLQKQKREKVIFSKDIIDLIDEDSRQCFDRHKDWLDALQKCVSRLPQLDRDLLHLRYHANSSIAIIANRFGCSLQKIYRNIARINNTLVHCVRHTIRLEEI